LDKVKSALLKWAKDIFNDAYEHGRNGDEIFADGLDADLHMEIENLLEELEFGKRIIVLPVPIGAPVFIPYRFIDADVEHGEKEEGVEEAHLSGYIKKEDREFYTTYDAGCTSDIRPDRLFTSREEAEAFLAETKGELP
jgi:hypothetical protein